MKYVPHTRAQVLNPSKLTEHLYKQRILCIVAKLFYSYVSFLHIWKQTSRILGDNTVFEYPHKAGITNTIIGMYFHVCNYLTHYLIADVHPSRCVRWQIEFIRHVPLDEFQQ